jgi:hypothetical protein
MRIVGAKVTSRDMDFGNHGRARGDGNPRCLGGVAQAKHPGIRDMGAKEMPQTGVRRSGLLEDAVVELFLAPILGGVHKREHNRMRLLLGG